MNTSPLGTIGEKRLRRRAGAIPGISGVEKHGSARLATTATLVTKLRLCFLSVAATAFGSGKMNVPRLVLVAADPKHLARGGRFVDPAGPMARLAHERFYQNSVFSLGKQHLGVQSDARVRDRRLEHKLCFDYLNDEGAHIS